MRSLVFRMVNVCKENFILKLQNLTDKVWITAGSICILFLVVMRLEKKGQNHNFPGNYIIIKF